MLEVKGLKPLVELLALDTELASGINLKLHCYIILDSRRYGAWIFLVEMGHASFQLTISAYSPNWTLWTNI